jgi:hypothetical protein
MIPLRRWAGRHLPSHIGTRLSAGAVVVLTACLIACGGASSSTPKPSAVAAVPVAGDPQLVVVWNHAEQYLAGNNIVLNAAAVVIQGTTPDIYPPDQRALGASSAGVTVTPVPDLTVVELQAENPGTTLKHNTDPTGIIHCPSNNEKARYCASYVSGTSIYVASSLEYSDNATGYEMQNIILARLGYDISKR